MTTALDPLSIDAARITILLTRSAHQALESALLITQQGTSWADFVLNKRLLLQRPIALLGFNTYNPPGQYAAMDVRDAHDYAEIEAPHLMAHWTVPCCGPKGPPLGLQLRARALRTANSGIKHLLCTASTDCSPCLFVRSSCWDLSTGDHWRGEDDWAGCQQFPCIRRSASPHIIGADQQIGSCPKG